MARDRSLRDGASSAARVLLYVVALGSVVHYRNDVHPANEASRVYAALALVDHGTVALDPVFDDLAPGWRAAGRPPNLDVATFDGTYRLDKAPGTTLLAVPIVAAIRAAGGNPSFATLTWMLAVLLSALPTALFAEALRRRLRREEFPGGDLAAVSIVIATPWLAYGGMLFGHALAAALAGGGMLLALGPVGRQRGEGEEGEAAAGGLLLGLAVLAEYPVAALAILACGAMVFDRGRRRLLPWVMLGALPSVAALLAWNTANFGSPWSMSYGFKAAPAFAALHAQGAYGMTLPSPERLVGILLGPTRGLLFLAPWLAAGLAGAVLAIRGKEVAPAWRVALAAGVPAWCLWISGFVDWTAGASFGPRHLVAGLPLLAVGAAVAFRRMDASTAGRLGIAAATGLAASAFFLDAAAAWTFPYADRAVLNPAAELAVPLLLEAGPAPTAWDALLPRPGGAILALLAALALLLPAMARALGAGRKSGTASETGDSPRPPAPPPGALARLLAVAALAAILHLAVATIPETPPEGTKRLLQNRAWAFEMLGRDDLAAAIRQRLQ